MNSDNTERTFDNITLEQYKICVSLAENLSSRIRFVNCFYMIMVGVLFLALNAVPRFIPPLFTKSGYYVMILVIMMANALWIWSLDYLFSLRDAKRKIIMDLEKNLPFQPLTKEWEGFENDCELKENSHRIIEIWLPKIIFLVCGYFMLGIVVKSLFWHY